MTFADFMTLALYDSVGGYYRQPRRRVGYEPGTDFFTASTSGAVFGELVAAACTRLLDGRNPCEHTFVEIGAEPVDASPAATAKRGILAGVEHPFGAVQTIGAGEPLLLSGKCVVFSNELFDAQPFHRYVWRAGQWRELGVRLSDQSLVFVELATATPASLPEEAAEGYVMDLPVAARELVDAIARQPWTGLFVAIDYGKSWVELSRETPAGTARAYFRHTQSNDLLARPGEQDLTCHVCWDWLSAALVQSGFAAPTLEAQEAFFIHHAGDFIAAASAADAARFSRRKLSLLQLLHPSHLGQKFQVLHALRPGVA